MLRKRHSPAQQATDMRGAGHAVERARMHLSEYSNHIQIAAVVLWLIFFVVAWFEENSMGMESQTSLIEYKDTLDMSEFEKCGDIAPPVQNGKELKTFWFSQYPDAVADDVIRNLVQTLTGLNAGVKSYYAQNKNFKRCHGGGQTVACLQIHPMFGVKTEELASVFNPEVFYMIRNPTTNFPAHQNTKAAKYAGQVGQTPEDGWRQFRDSYAVKMFDGWKNQLTTWRNMSYYNVAMYVPLEQLMDPTHGPQLAKDMVAILRSRGYATTSDADISCVWYQSIGKDALQFYHRYRYNYDTYTPGYTKDQLKFLAQGISDFAAEIDDDPKLLEVLQQYRASILLKTRVDHAWVNETAAR